MVGYMYIIHSLGDEVGLPGKNLSYAGYAKFPHRRIRQHNGEITGGAHYTSRRKNWKFVCITRFSTERLARQAEWRIHRRKGRARKGSVKTRRILDLCRVLTLEKVTSTAPITATEDVTVYWESVQESLDGITWPSTITHQKLTEFPELRST